MACPSQAMPSKCPSLRPLVVHLAALSAFCFVLTIPCSRHPRSAGHIAEKQLAKSAASRNTWGKFWRRESSSRVTVNLDGSRCCSIIFHKLCSMFDLRCAQGSTLVSESPCCLDPPARPLQSPLGPPAQGPSSGGHLRQAPWLSLLRIWRKPCLALLQNTSPASRTRNVLESDKLAVNLYCGRVSAKMPDLASVPQTSL